MSELASIQTHLGDKASYYLEHVSKTVSKDKLHLPSPTFVNDIWVNSDRNPQTLRSIEDLFGLQPLGYAGKSKAFGDDVYNGPRCFDTPLPAGTGRLPRGTLVKSVGRTGHVLKIMLARSAKLTVTGIVSNGPRYTAKRRGKACHTVRLRVRGGTRSMKITATRGGRSERRTYRIH